WGAASELEKRRTVAYRIQLEPGRARRGDVFGRRVRHHRCAHEGSRSARRSRGGKFTVLSHEAVEGPGRDQERHRDRLAEHGRGCRGGGYVYKNPWADPDVREGCPVRRNRRLVARAACEISEQPRIKSR